MNIFRLSTILALLLSLGCGQVGAGGMPATQEDAQESPPAVDAGATPEEGPPVDPPPMEPSELPAPETLQLSGVCPPEDRFGGFIVQSEADYSFVQGEIAEGVVPGTIMEEVVREGGCVLLKRNTPFCDPGCAAGQACTHEGACVPYPAPKALGEVAVDGLLGAVRIDEPAPPGAHYFDTGLPHPAMEVGGTIRLRTSGGHWPAFELLGAGVETLSVGDDARWTVVSGEGLEVTWEASEASRHTEVRLSLNIDQHGVTPTTMYCVFEDTGAATVPASVIEGLLSAGVTGFPSGLLTRRTADRVQVGAGCADLRVRSSREVPVTVDGFTPCGPRTPCPAGETCAAATGLCE